MYSTICFLVCLSVLVSEVSSNSDTCDADGSGESCKPAAAKVKQFREYYFKTKKVPRLSAKEKLTNQLIAQQQPVVIKDTNIVASALNWTLDYLAENIGDGQFMLCLSDDNRFMYYDEKRIPVVKGFQLPHERISVTFKEFHERLKMWKKGEPWMYLQESLKEGVNKQMLKDFASFNWEWAHGQQKRNNWKDFTTNLLLIAQGGAITPAHYDEQENFLAQISGTKRVLFAAPNQFVNLYPYPYFHPCDRQSQVDFENPDFERFPKAAKVEIMEAIIKPGDVIYIPPYWWHHVESAFGDDYTMSLTFWYKSAPIDKISYPLTADQKVTMMRNIEKMITEALINDPIEITNFFRDLTLGRYADFPIDQ